MVLAPSGQAPSMFSVDLLMADALCGVFTFPTAVILGLILLHFARGKPGYGFVIMTAVANMCIIVLPLAVLLFLVNGILELTNIAPTTVVTLITGSIVGMGLKMYVDHERKAKKSDTCSSDTTAPMKNRD